MTSTLLMHKAQFIIILILVILFTTSCSLIDNNNSQELKKQVSALETQNALLSQQINNSSGNNTNNDITAPLPPSGNTNSTLTISTQTIESLPKEPVTAGIPIIYEGWALTLSPEIGTGRYDISSTKYPAENYFTINFSIRNIGEQARIFRFIKSGVSVSDNLGNNYDFLFDTVGCYNELDDFHLNQQISIESGNKFNITSATNWCDWNDHIPAIKGVIPISAEQIYISISNWGPFNDIVFYIDL